MTRTHAWLATAAGALVVLGLSPAGIAAEAGAAAPQGATTPVSPAPDGAPIQELDEVVVRGKRVLEQIHEEEEAFYKVFNDVNKDDRYDTHCVTLRMQEGSQLQTRTCMPGFVADAMADWAPYKARCQPPMEMKYGRDGPEFACLDRNNDGRLSLDEASARQELGAAFFDIDTEGNGSISGEEYQTAMDERTDLSAPVVHMPATPDMVLANGAKKWSDHMTEVVKSDPRLSKMAAHLGDLYYELSLAQRKINQLDAAAKEEASKRNMGKRIH